MNQQAQLYLIRALVYAGSYGLNDYFEAATVSGRDTADFLIRSVSEQRMKQSGYVLHGVRTETWWRMFGGAFRKLGDLDEMRVKELLEATGYWYWIKAANQKQIFSTHNMGKIYDVELAQNGWRLIRSQKHLRSVVDRFNAGK